MEREILKREDIKIITSRELSKPKNLLFLFQKGWSQRAGVVPYVYKNGEYYLLLGKKIKNDKLTDFGGGCKKVEIPIDCAIREFREETRETIDFDYRNITHVLITGKKGPHQVILLVRFENMGNEEQNFQDSLSEKMPKGMNELSMIRWFLKDKILIHYNRNRLEESLSNILKYLMF